MNNSGLLEFLKIQTLTFNHDECYLVDRYMNMVDCHNSNANYTDSLGLPDF
ncbi:hypothetical protein FC65_GL000946 [Ligilactobacillus acidipiscis DSM 15836]|uniref:Uncharacterized protein n=1 Tax=Ligilactobacillus acidipiscis DSM 15836 TaxID=1423716 RepID=A0ABR5PHI4_9LACO|nr:hypothetical protein FC65_GL000946 [Ligilactobacillus acidipiscis DSM 15836]